MENSSNLVRNEHLSVLLDLMDFKEQFLDMRNTKYLKTVISDIISLHFKNVQNLMIIKYHLENFNKNDVLSIYSQVETTQNADPFKKTLHKQNLGIAVSYNKLISNTCGC